MGRGESKESMWPKLHHLYDNAIKIVVLMLFFFQFLMQYVVNVLYLYYRLY